MGVVTDFVVADRADAKRIGDERDWFDGLSTSKGIDQVRMGTLYGILTGQPYDPEFMITEDSFAYTASEDVGPWVQVVPEDMVRRLATIPARDVARIGDEWFQTEEFQPQYSTLTRADLDDFLRSIQAFARKAVQHQQTLFMWTCL